MKGLNDLVVGYTRHLQEGEIQAAYRGILEFIGKLRADFVKRSRYDTGNIYQGYMDMTYFSLTTKALKDNGLKLAVVYLHEKGAFEVWLSARNRDMAGKFRTVLSSGNFDKAAVFHEEDNQDAIIECKLTASPDFENQAALIDIIEQGVEKFEAAINDLI